MEALLLAELIVIDLAIDHHITRMEPAQINALCCEKITIQRELRAWRQLRKLH